MRLGMFMMPLHPVGRPMHAYLAEDTEKALLLEKLGFDELFIGEHYSAATEPYPSPLMFAASLVPRTERLVFGTGVINAPLHHPAMIAAEAAQFDHLSKGRFILGIGSGSTPTDNEMMNVSPDARERGKMLAESIEMIERIWASDPPYDFSGTYWTTRIKDTVNPALNFGWLPKPYQKPRPPIAIPSSSPDSASVKVAGRKGWSVISSGLLSTQDLASHWALYRQGCQEAGRQAERRRLARLPVRPRRRHRRGGARARLQRRERLSAFLRPHAQGLQPARPPRRAQDAARHARRRGDGGYLHRAAHDLRLAQDRAGRADRAARDAGPFGTLLLSAVDWAGPNAAWERKSLTRLAQEVMPALREKTVAA